MSTERKIRTTKRLAKSKAHRDAFVSAHIKEGLSFQIRALRKQRKWNQKKLGELAGFNQSKISDFENPNYLSDLNLDTVKRLASAFDVALVIRFVSFGEQISWVSDLIPGSLEVFSFENDPQCQAWLQIASSASAGMAARPLVVSKSSAIEGNSTASQVQVQMFRHPSSPYHQLNP